MRPADGPISPAAITRAAEVSLSAAIVGAAPEAGTPRGRPLPRMKRRRSRVARTDSRETRRDRHRQRTRQHFAERCRQRDRRKPHRDAQERHRERPCHVRFGRGRIGSGWGGNRAGRVAISSGAPVLARAGVAVASASDAIATDREADGSGHVAFTGDTLRIRCANGWHAPRLSPRRTRLRPGAAWSHRHRYDQRRCGARPPSGRGSGRIV